MLESELAAMVDGYLEAALWSSSCDCILLEEYDCDSLDNHADMGDIPTAEYGAVSALLREFTATHESDVLGYLAERDAAHFGHDFWLTRSGHGVGFWDRGLGDLGRRLTDNCRPYGEAWPYVGDDGLVYGLA